MASSVLNKYCLWNDVATLLMASKVPRLRLSVIFFDLIKCGWIGYPNLTTVLHNHATYEGLRVILNNFNHNLTSCNYEYSTCGDAFPLCQRGWQLKQEGQVAGLLNKHGC